MKTIRYPAVAGTFYPGDPEVLRQEVEAYLDRAVKGDLQGGLLRALALPHAGYVYSAPIAASGYGLLASRPEAVRRVVLLGPSHRVAFEGLAQSGADFYRTPLGDVPLQRHAGLPEMDAAHADEHSLEVHLPFLQVLLPEFLLLPVVVGRASFDQVAVFLSEFVSDPSTLMVVSTDLSHFLNYDAARKMDTETTAAILALNADALTPERACGCSPLGGLLHCARAQRWTPRLLDQRNSADTAGSPERVVGYGAYAFVE